MFKRAICITLILPLMLIASCSSEPEPVGPPLEGEVDELASEFINFLVAEEYTSARAFFNAEMSKAMSERALKQAWEGTQSELGGYVGEIEKQIQSTGEYEAVNVHSQFGDGQLNIRVVFDTDNRVAGLWFLPIE